MQYILKLHQSLRLWQVNDRPQDSRKDRLFELYYSIQAMHVCSSCTFVVDLCFRVPLIIEAC
jgi:hypothetical protein